MHDRFAARCKAAAAAAANLAYIIRYIHSLPLSIYTYIRNGLSNGAANDSLRCRHDCLPLALSLRIIHFTACRGWAIPHHSIQSSSHSSSSSDLFPANCSLRRYANCMEINYFRNWNWRFSDSSPKMFWSMSNFIVNALVHVVVVIMSVPQRRLKDQSAL